MSAFLRAAIRTSLWLLLISRGFNADPLSNKEIEDLPPEKPSDDEKTKREVFYDDVFYDGRLDDDYSLLNYVHLNPGDFRRSHKRPSDAGSLLKNAWRSKLISHSQFEGDDKNPARTSISESRVEPRNKMLSHTLHSSPKKKLFNRLDVKHVLIMSKLDRLKNSKDVSKVGESLVVSNVDQKGNRHILENGQTLNSFKPNCVPFGPKNDNSRRLEDDGGLGRTIIPQANNSYNSTENETNDNATGPTTIHVELFRGYLPLLESGKIQRQKVVKEFLNERRRPSPATSATAPNPLEASTQRSIRLSLSPKNSACPSTEPGPQSRLVFPSTAPVTLLGGAHVDSPMNTLSFSKQRSTRRPHIEFEGNLFSVLYSLVKLINSSQTVKAVDKMGIASPTKPWNQSVLIRETKGTSTTAVKWTSGVPKTDNEKDAFQNLNVNFDSFDSLEGWGDRMPKKTTTQATPHPETRGTLLEPKELGSLKHTCVFNVTKSKDDRHSTVPENLASLFRSSNIVTRPKEKLAQREFMSFRPQKGKYASPQNSLIEQGGRRELTEKTYHVSKMELNRTNVKPRQYFNDRQRRKSKSAPKRAGKSPRQCEDTCSINCTHAAEEFSSSRTTPRLIEATKCKGSTIKVFEVHTRQSVPFNLSVGSISCPECHQEFTYRLGLMKIAVKNEG